MHSHVLGGLLSAEKVRVVEPKGTLERENQPVFDVPIVRLATGGRDGTARLWDLTARDPAANPIVLRGPEGDFQSEGLDLVFGHFRCGTDVKPEVDAWIAAQRLNRLAQAAVAEAMARWAILFDPSAGHKVRSFN